MSKYSLITKALTTWFIKNSFRSLKWLFSRSPTPSQKSSLGEEGRLACSIPLLNNENSLFWQFHPKGNLVQAFADKISVENESIIENRFLPRQKP